MQRIRPLTRVKRRQTGSGALCGVLHSASYQAEIHSRVRKYIVQKGFCQLVAYNSNIFYMYMMAKINYSILTHCQPFFFKTGCEVRWTQVSRWTLCGQAQVEQRGRCAQAEGRRSAVKPCRLDSGWAAGLVRVTNLGVRVWLCLQCAHPLFR